jgi:hypothetical protein
VPYVPMFDHWYSCPTCRKRTYYSRKLARRAIREMRDSKGMREYPSCGRRDHWHVGHIPPNVRKGLITVGEIYRRYRERSSRSE